MMKSFVATQAFLLVLYLVGSNGRHVDQNEYEDLPEAEDQTELLNRMRDHVTQTRHHRRSRQMHGYDYPAPFYYDRRDYGSRLQDEYLSRILKSLDEIISYIKRPPPPPPQPVYIPYPVLQYVRCRLRPNSNTTGAPDLFSRFPEFEDENQLWGSPIEEVPEAVGSDDDGSRPISLKPIEPNRPTSRPPPAVDHGSNQAESAKLPPRRPGVCETAILTCCSVDGKTSQKNCFARYNCLKTYNTNRACNPAIIKQVIENFSNAYAPVIEN